MKFKSSLTMFLIERRIRSNLLIQFVVLDIIDMKVFNNLWKCSTMSLTMEWQAVVLMCFEPNKLLNSQNKADWNCFPMSVLITCEGPNVTIHSPSITFRTMFVVVSLIDIVVSHWEYLLTIVNRYWYHWYMSRRPTISMCRCVNWVSGLVKMPTGNFISLTF